MRCGCVRPQHSAHIQPVHVGEHQVDEKDIGLLFDGKGNSRFSIPCANNAKSLLFKIISYELDQVRFVVNDKHNAFGHSCILTTPGAIE